MFFIGANMKSKLLTECLAVNLALFYSDTCSEFISIRSMPCLQKNEGGVQKGYKEHDDCYLSHYAQWFFRFFFILSCFVFTIVIVMMVDR